MNQFAQDEHVRETHNQTVQWTGDAERDADKTKRNSYANFGIYIAARPAEMSLF